MSETRDAENFSTPLETAEYIVGEVQLISNTIGEAYDTKRELIALISEAILYAQQAAFRAGAEAQRIADCNTLCRYCNRQRRVQQNSGGLWFHVVGENGEMVVCDAHAIRNAAPVGGAGAESVNAELIALRQFVTAFDAWLADGEDDESMYRTMVTTRRRCEPGAGERTAETDEQWSANE